MKNEVKNDSVKNALRLKLRGEANQLLRGVVAGLEEVRNEIELFLSESGVPPHDDGVYVQLEHGAFGAIQTAEMKLSQLTAMVTEFKMRRRITEAVLRQFADGERPMLDDARAAVQCAIGGDHVKRIGR